MKRCLLIIFLSIMMMPFVNVKAIENNVLNYYVEVGIGTDEMLVLDGYTYLSGNVVWDKEGEYVVNYLNESGEKVEVQFNITVKSNENKYYYEFQKNSKINIDPNYIVKDFYYLNDDSCYIVANDTNCDSLELDNTQISVLYFVNGILKWEYKYKTNSAVIKCCLNGDNLIVSGNTYTYPSSIIVFEINPNRQIINEKTINGEDNVILKDMYIFDNNILLITETSSNELDFKNLNSLKVKNGIILSISLSDWQIIDSLALANDNISIKTITADNNFLHLIIKNLNNNTFKYLKISYYLVIYKSENFSIINNIIKSFVFDGQLYYISEMNKTVSFNNLYKSICQIDFIDSNNINLLYNNNEVYFLLYNNEILKYVIKFNGNYCEQITLNFEGKLLKNEQFILLIDNNSTINYYDFHLLEFINDNEKKVIYNGVIYEPSNEINIDNDIYGDYSEIMFINILDKYNICYLEEVKVPLIINIEEHKTYDKGLELLFNGHGKLGKLDIESGYIINDIGNYSLEIYGNNGQKTTINFSVEDLMKHPMIEEQPNINIDNVDYQEKRTQPEINNYYQIYSQNNQYLFVIISMFIIVLGLLGIIIWRKYKK